MATAKKTATGKTAHKAPAKSSTKPASKASPTAMKPIKAVLNKTELTNHLAAAAGVEPKVVKAVMGALEQTVLASLNKKGAAGFVLPGLLKLTTQAVPAQKARKGINPFTKEEVMFKAKPASVKLRLRALKKLKDAAA